MKIAKEAGMALKHQPTNQSSVNISVLLPMKNICINKLCTQVKQALLLTLLHKVLHSGPGGEDHCLNGIVLMFL